MLCFLSSLQPGFLQDMLPGLTMQSPMIRQPSHTRLSPSLTSPGLASNTTPVMVENATYVTAHGQQVPSYQGFPYPGQVMTTVKEKVSPPSYSSLQYSLQSPSNSLSTSVVQTQLPVPAKQQVYIASVKQQTPLAPGPFVPQAPVPHAPPVAMPAHVAVPCDTTHSKQSSMLATLAVTTHVQSTSAQTHGIGAQSALPPSHHLKDFALSSQPQDRVGQVTFTNSRPHMSVSPCLPGSHASSSSSSSRLQQMGEVTDANAATANKPFAVVSAQPSKGPSSEVTLASNEGSDKGTSPMGTLALPLPGSSKVQVQLKPMDGGDGSTPRLSPGKSDRATHIKCAVNRNVVSAASSTSHQAGGERSEETLKSITKNIQDAFVESNEKKLMAAFEDAWKKFQANGKKYEHVAQQVKRHVQPIIGEETQRTVKVKVVPPPSKTSSPVVQAVPVCVGQGPTPAVSTSIVQLAGSSHAATPGMGLGPAPFMSSPPPYYVVYAAPQPSPQIHIAVPPVQGRMQTPPDMQFVQQQPSSGSEYALYTTMQPSQAKNLVQTAGVYFPSSMVHPPGNAQHHAQRASNAASQAQSVPKPTEQSHAVHSPSPSSVPIPTKQASTPNHGFGPLSKLQPSSAPSQKVKSKSIRICSRCGNEATYLCSGCQQEWYCGRDCQVRPSILPHV